MTEIEKSIISIINEHPSKVKIFWDMDGTCASMEMDMLEQKLEKGFFNKKRPINTIISIMEKCFNLGAETYILSFCHYSYQKEDKLEWIKNYIRFLPIENAIIIPRKEKDSKKAESKETLKAEYIKDYVSNGDIVYMVDDNESVLLGTKKVLPFINIISPIDFID